jgi:hypothetical protein
MGPGCFVERAMKPTGPIPEHLKKFAWYAPHQAWLAQIGYAHHDPAGAVAKCAVLKYANLMGAYLMGAVLMGAELTDADLTGADLTGAVLTDADLTDAVLTDARLTDAVLTDAVLTDADLKGAVLTGAKGLAIPVIENIDQKVLDAIESGTGFDMRDWHGKAACGTTHCRAGMAIHLAGEAGYALEKRISAHMAGYLIYRASRPGKECPDFFCSNAQAMESIKADAAAEKAAK